jgi:enoyl-CoA hydratase/carnithine racemase
MSSTNTKTPVVQYEKKIIDGENIYILYLKNSPYDEKLSGYENKISGQFLRDFHLALDWVQQQHQEGSGGAIISIGQGRHYSNGLDLEYLMSLNGVEAQLNFLKDVEKLFLRLLTFPLPTISAMNGHAFAGGFLLALAHDYRIMNSDKGFACMTEIDIQSSLTGGFNAILKEKLPRHLATRMMMEALRQNAHDLENLHVVDKAVPASKVLETAIEWGKMVAPKAASKAMVHIKEDLFCDVIDILRQDKVMVKGFGNSSNKSSKL